MEVPTGNSEPFTCFVGVDIAAKTFTVAISLGEAKPKLEKKSFEQTAEDFTRFLAYLSTTGTSPAETLIVMEATGSYWVALALTLSSCGYRVSMANPKQIHYFALAQLKRAKSDSLDALTLCEFAQTKSMRLTIWTPPPQFYHELRQRIAQRESLLKLQNQLHNQLDALKLNPIVIESVRLQLEALLFTLATQITQMDKELKALIKAELSDFEKIE